MNLQAWRESGSSSAPLLYSTGDHFADWVVKMRKKLKKDGQQHVAEEDDSVPAEEASAVDIRQLAEFLLSYILEKMFNRTSREFNPHLASSS